MQYFLSEASFYRRAFNTDGHGLIRWAEQLIVPLEAWTFMSEDKAKLSSTQQCRPGDQEWSILKKRMKMPSCGKLESGLASLQWKWEWKAKHWISWLGYKNKVNKTTRRLWVLLSCESQDQWAWETDLWALALVRVFKVVSLPAKQEKQKVLEGLIQGFVVVGKGREAWKAAHDNLWKCSGPPGSSNMRLTCSESCPVSSWHSACQEAVRLTALTTPSGFGRLVVSHEINSS